jgi:hypothetical protein
MFIKGFITFLITSILGIGATSTRVYIAPDKTPAQTKSTSTSQTIKPIETKIVSTSTKKVAVVKTKSSTTTKPNATTEKPKEAEKGIDISKLPPPDFENINNYSRKAVVNILCSTKGAELSPTSGTGVIINPKGIILTNAHIAQYFLLKDFRQKDYVSCVIRTGSPAYPTYKAELMYISPTWIGQNKGLLKQVIQRGTGENDFAFLRITERVDGGKISPEFPFIIPDIREVVQIDEPVLLVSYPAGFLGGTFILQDLNITSSIAKINDLFTFKQNTIDLIDVGGTIVSQKGSSGGAVVDYFVSLLGIITTSSEESTTDKRVLRAITLAHINRSLQSEIGINIPGLLAQDPKQFADTFASTTAPLLSKMMIDVLENKN